MFGMLTVTEAMLFVKPVAFIIEVLPVVLLSGGQIFEVFVKVVCPKASETPQNMTR